jgi:multidrug efflux pump subunit AcrA (membrane-fusion protein)
MDMARAQGKKEAAYWEKTYRPTPIMAPVDGILIARNIVEGQTVNGGTPLYDLSDSLVVRAQVDENDIGKVALGQKAEVTLDSFPDEQVGAVVDLINPSAVLINQVVSYYVLLRVIHAPGTMKTGMTANIDLILSEKKGVLTLPSYVVKGDGDRVLTLAVVRDPARPPEMRKVTLGSSDGNRVEVLAGLAEHEKVAVTALKLQDAAAGGPFGGNNSNGKVKSSKDWKK